MSRDYREKDVVGFIADVRDSEPTPANVIVRMTSDDRGKSLTLQAYNIMIGIPLEMVEGIIKITERRDR